MAAQPGGLCGPGVRSEGSRNTAEPCTRLPGAGRRCPSRLLGPRTCGGPRRFSPPARHPASGSAVTPALPRAFPALARGSWAAGPAIAEPPAPRLRGSVAGVQPRSPRTPPPPQALRQHQLEHQACAPQPRPRAVRGEDAQERPGCGARCEAWSRGCGVFPGDFRPAPGSQAPAQSPRTCSTQP
jgi:hypothetical protein